MRQLTNSSMGPPTMLVIRKSRPLVSGGADFVEPKSCVLASSTSDGDRGPEGVIRKKGENKKPRQSEIACQDMMRRQREFSEGKGPIGRTMRLCCALYPIVDYIFVDRSGQKRREWIGETHARTCPAVERI
jgi:hypothetical protein